MNPQKTTIAILAALSVSLALADDFKTNSGKEYKNAIVTQVDPDGIVVRTKTGISKLYFPELPEDVRKQFHYDPQNAAAYAGQEAAARKAAAQQAEESIKEQKELQKQQGQLVGKQQNIQALKNAYQELVARRAGFTGRNWTNKECARKCPAQVVFWTILGPVRTPGPHLPNQCGGS
jgi:hypothetical protein